MNTLELVAYYIIKADGSLSGGGREQPPVHRRDICGRIAGVVNYERCTSQTILIALLSRRPSRKWSSTLEVPIGKQGKLVLVLISALTENTHRFTPLSELFQDNWEGQAPCN